MAEQGSYARYGTDAGYIKLTISGGIREGGSQATTPPSVRWSPAKTPLMSARIDPELRSFHLASCASVRATVEEGVAYFMPSYFRYALTQVSKN